MFEIFGNFDSAEEINLAAEGLKREGDCENLKVLAKENGIGEEFVQLYLEGEIPFITDPVMAAMGKLETEKEEIKSRMPVGPIVDYLNTLCGDVDFAKAIRRESKNLSDCIKKIEKKCEEECKRTKQQYVADMTVFRWARAYYMEG